MADEKIVCIYVSVDGNDSAKGTVTEPLATLEGAKRLLRSMNCNSGAKIKFTEGVYSFNDSVLFEANDGGTKESPVIYEAEGDVIFSGGVTIPYEKVNSVTDCEMAARLPDARKVKAVDLSDIGISKDTIFGVTESAPRFYAGNKLYENARFPNREKISGKDGSYIYSKRIVVEDRANGKEHGIRFYYDDENVGKRMAKWAPQAYEDMYIFGYFWHQWNYCSYKAESGDSESGALTARFGGRGYEIIGDTEGENRRQFISNVPEELDAEGEYYYDRKKSTLYFIPNDDYTEGMPVTISILNRPAVIFNGAKNIEFRGVKFSYFNCRPVSVEQSDGISFVNCEFSHLSQCAAEVNASVNCKFDSCDIFDAASGGIYFVNCGDRYNLQHSNNAVVNCIIHDVNRVLKCYRPAIHCKNTCGLDIKGCTLSHAPHALIILEHINDIMIEENRITDACLDTDDSSAVYWGRDPSDLGIVIRRNYFANIGNKKSDYSIAAIYVDDWATCAEIYNNIFYNCGELSREKMTVHTNANSIVLNNAQFLKTYNNIFVGTYQDQKPTNLYPCVSIARWITLVNGIAPDSVSPSEVSWYETLEKAGFMTDTWKKHYQNSAWAGMWDYVNEDIRRKVVDYINERTANGNVSSKRVYVDIAWAVLDRVWDHITEEGENFHGTFYEYFKSAYAEEFKEKLADYENNCPTEGSGIEGHIFWKAVRHELKFRTTNIFENNLVIGMDRAYLTDDEHLQGHVMNGFYQNYTPYDDKIANGESMFIKYGENFTLTPDGIAEVHKRLPEFHNISMDGMGAKR